MAFETPPHEPEDKVERLRDFGDTLAKTGYVLAVAALITAVFIPSALRGEGAWFVPVIAAVLAVAALACVLYGARLKKHARRLRP